MPRYRRKNIDRKTNKPDLKRTVTPRDDQILNRAEQIRRDDDVVKTPKRTLYDIDYAIKWFIDNEIQPQIEANNELIKVPVIFANGEKWDNVRRLGYLRDEKGMLQSPIIVLKRNSVVERDQLRKLDVNYPVPGNFLSYRKKYNKRNRYEDELFPIPKQQRSESNEIYVLPIPEYVDVEYDMMIWTDFTTQMNELIEQIMPYGTFAWGNEFNQYRTFVRQINFETINTVGDDRLVRATTSLTVNGTLMADQEYRQSTVQKRYSIKKIQWAVVIDVEEDIFSTTTVPQQLIDAQQRIISGNCVMVSNTTSGGSSTTIDAGTMTYLTSLVDKNGTYVSGNTITISSLAATNPLTALPATKNEFDVYINGQYIDKVIYTWSPSNSSTQTIIFDTATLGYALEADDVIIVNGRWDS
jgi:glutaredoxin